MPTCPDCKADLDNEANYCPNCGEAIDAEAESYADREDLSPTAPRTSDSTLEGHVTRVKDGDTIVVSLDEGRTVDVRLWGVDAPESDQPYGPVATKAARKIAKNKTCSVVVRDHDHHGRIIGRVFVSEKSIDVGHSLVTSGYAWHRTKYVTGHQELSDQLEESQAQARREELGLWTQSNPIPPWEWRKQGSPSSDVEDVVQAAKKGHRWTKWLLSFLR